MIEDVWRVLRPPLSSSVMTTKCLMESSRRKLA